RAPSDVHCPDAGGRQRLTRSGASTPGLADHIDGTRRVYLGTVISHLGERDVAGTRHVAVPVLVRFAHIDDDCGRDGGKLVYRDLVHVHASFTTDGGSGGYG